MPSLEDLELSPLPALTDPDSQSLVSLEGAVLAAVRRCLSITATAPGMA